MSAMWKNNEGSTITAPGEAEPVRVIPAVVSASSASQAIGTAETTISKGIVFMGEIKGTESLFVDGKVEGSIILPGNRVTVGRNGQVAASITARELVILGKVRGNVNASDRVDIRAEGALTGDIVAARISIEDGAFFKGGIDIRKPAAVSATSAGQPTGRSEAALPSEPARMIA